MTVTLPDTARRLLNPPVFAVLTTVNADGGPQSSVVWLRTEGDDLVFSTIRGRLKCRNMEREPRVSVCAYDPADPYTYVEVRGTVTMTEDGGASEPGGLSRTRLIGARVLTVVAILLALVGMLAFYVAHTALDAAGFETISRNMIENDAIRTQVANTAVDQLYANVDVEAAIADRLPPDQKGLAPVLAGLSRSGADRAADAALERPRVQTAWVDVTTATQRQLVRLLDDKNKFVETDGGKVVLDLRPIMIELGDQVVVIGRLAEKLPDSAGKITIVDESQLETAQTITKILRAVANWMWLPEIVGARTRDCHYTIVMAVAGGVGGSSSAHSPSACFSSGS